MIKCLLVLRCQLYMFQTVTVHPQELLFRCCMCRLWYVLIGPAGTTFEEELKRCTSGTYQIVRFSDTGWVTEVSGFDSRLI